MFFFVYYAIVYFIMGVLIGSFLNVCIFRIPLNQTVVTTPSHCMSCNHKLAWYDLFPLFSWLFLGGKCRYCKAKISAQYPLVEFLNGILYLSVYLVLKPAGVETIAYSIIYCMFFSALLVLSFIDLKHRTVPVKINIFILILAIPILILDRANWLSHLIGFFSISVPLLIIALVSNGMGGGDIKLFAVCGLLLGWQKTIVSLAAASISGSIIGILILLLYKPKDGRKTRIPFVPFIALGMLISTLFGDAIINWYVSSFLTF